MYNQTSQKIHWQSETETHQLTLLDQSEIDPLAVRN